MATKEQMVRLRKHWPLVIQYLYDDIEFIPKGSPESIDTLLSGWGTTPAKPTEAALISGLATVEDRIAAAATIRADILAKVQPSVGISTDWIVLDVTAKDNLLMALLLKLGALDEDGLLRPTDEWANGS